MDTPKTIIICTKCGRKYEENDLVPATVEANHGWRKAKVCPCCHSDYYLMDMDESCVRHPARTQWQHN